MDSLEREIKTEDEPTHLLYSCLSCSHLNFQSDDDLKKHKLECHGEGQSGVEDPGLDPSDYDYTISYVEDEELYAEEQEDTTPSSIIENPDNVCDTGIILIEKFQLNSAESLRFLINLEEKTIIPAYEKNKTFTPHERGVIARLLIKNVLKSNVDRTITRKHFEFYAKLICTVFPLEEPETYFAYVDKISKGTLHNIYQRIKKEYKMAGLYDAKPAEKPQPDNYERHQYNDAQFKVLRESGNYPNLYKSIALDPPNPNLYKSLGLEIPKKQPLDFKLDHIFLQSAMDLEARENQEHQKQDQCKRKRESSEPFETAGNSGKIFKDFLENRLQTSNYLEEKPPDPEDPDRELDGTVIIKNFKLNTKENLRFLIELEEKTLIPSYEKNGTFTPFERGTLTRLIIKNVLKPDIDRILTRKHFQFYAKLICELFPNEEKNLYFAYVDKNLRGSLYYTFTKLRREYRDAGLIKTKGKDDD